MKRNILLLVTVLFSVFSVFADNISVADITLNINEQQTVDFCLSNSNENIVGVQFDMTLPEGVSPVMTDGNVTITTSSRISGTYTLRGKDMGNNVYKFLFMSTDRTALSSTSGAVFSIKLKNADAESGTHTATLSDITLSDIDGNQKTLEPLSFTITTTTTILGDANGDGSVTVTDFTAVANAILGNPSANYNAKAADVNQDNEVTVSDLTGIANIILYGSITFESSNVQ